MLSAEQNRTSILTASLDLNYKGENKWHSKSKAYERKFLHQNPKSLSVRWRRLLHPAADQERLDKMITLYSKKNCTYCDRAKIWLEKNGFQYHTVDVQEENGALEFISGRGHKTVPQLYYDGKLLVENGYTGLSKLDPEELRERLEHGDMAA